MMVRTAWMVSFLALAIASDPAFSQTIPVIPIPADVAPAAGRYRVTAATGVAVDPADAGAARAADLLIAQVRTDRGLTLNRKDGGGIRIVRDDTVTGEEAYRLTISRSGVTIAASGDRGMIWGAMTLAQLLSPDAKAGQPVSLAAVTISDAPRFSWRGLMMDVSRHFQPVETLYPIVDAMMAQKLNTLHLHLSDDQGWRVEIKRYPDLTRIGGFRTPPSAGEPPREKVGGFYTQDELKKLVAYAAERGIVIVPEIDLPGHAQAAVAAYPQEIGVLGDRPQVGNEWGVNPWLFAPNERSMTFIKNVLDELVEIFPSPIIHVGGDEAVKDQWKRSPAVQAQMKALGLTTENQLQGWMIAELGKHLASKGRRLIGWDEILEGDVPTSASVMSWRGDKGAVEAANKGHDVVLSPAPNLYFDNLQSDRSDEPPGRLGIQTLEQVYGYDPQPPGIDPAKLKHVLGAQANAWSEYLVTPEQKQHAIFPRLSALAELTWSPKEKRDWRGFVARLEPQMVRYRREGVGAADSAFAVNFRPAGGRGDALRQGMVTLGMDNQTKRGVIRYTLDGKQPTARSPVFKAPIEVKAGAVVTAAPFAADGRAMAAPRQYAATRAAWLSAGPSDLSACPQGALGLRVPLAGMQTANTPAFNVNIFDTCTQWLKAPLGEARGFAIDVARLPRHYGLAHEASALREHYAVTRFGELVVTAGGCKGRVVGTYPLPDPASAPNRFRFTGTLSGEAGDADLCFQFTSPLSHPFYAVEGVTLEDAR
ncbi:family 20 glycosylhydrolase [Sphingomonas sp. BGYR3]|uniref:beta-N-acetylhexosaminidase n=1 Tax=Sphingomonas sp. BGYR3 TaxID=2975483 RepID=UPI0021A2FCFB|nr:family 20 glycosylhydrolase [Sphingomonas sp. BGYR3]MDG5487237.1 family 20 glycosylhydrolase [Sphingomonas sp. BGYR3]